MTETPAQSKGGPVLRPWIYGAGLTGVIALSLVPEAVIETTRFIAVSFIQVAPIVIPGIVIAAWVAASGAGDHVAAAFRGRTAATLFAAAAIGAVTPVCGVTVLPLMAGLLAAGVPLAPVMAFWLSSPITDPAMLAVTAATLGPTFAVAKTVAAFGLGLAGGAAVAALAGRTWIRAPLSENRMVRRIRCGNCASGTGFTPAIWRESGRRLRFGREVWSISRLILICLVPAFAAEFWLNAALRPEALTAYLGAHTWWAIPFAVFVGGPAYIDGYAALPLTRVLIEHGMAPGAAMAFLVSGGVVSVWGAMAIFPVLKLKAFLLYIALALAGSLLAGWGFQLVA